MKKLLVLAALGAAVAAQAQIASVERPEPLMAGVHTDLYNPILSADGSMLLFSSADYSNLRIYDFASGAAQTISTEARSGLDAQFTADGRQVVYVSQHRDASGINMRSKHTYSIDAQANTTAGSARRMVARPVVKNHGNGVRTEGSTLYIIKNGVEKAYQPVGECAGYIWASLSPDASKVMFFAAGKGIVITDLDGRILATPGKFECPVWFGNDHIVAQNATDDGHQYRSSQIVLLTADGSARQDITRPESMTITPAASFDASKVVYSTIDGRMFQVKVNILK